MLKVDKSKVDIVGDGQSLLSEFILLFKVLENRYAKIGVDFKRIFLKIIKDKKLQDFNILWGDENTNITKGDF